MTISDQICYSTVRIETQMTNGGRSTGTGFYFNFLNDKDAGTCVPCIITNKHVIEGAVSGIMFMTYKLNDGTEHSEKVVINDFIKPWLFHPDHNVDLCVLPIAFIIGILDSRNKKLFYIALDESLIPNQSQLEDLMAMEDIVMVGYPNGIWDEVNNKPILRRGITATHPKRNFNNEKKFLIDMACFPGSSGSPILIMNHGGYVDNLGNLNWGKSRLFLLGILYAGPIYNAKGEMHFGNIPSITTSIPNNLGLVIKSERIMEMESLIKSSLGEG